MKWLSKISFLAMGLCLVLTLQAQPKREFRAAWLTTVWAIDWPKPHSQSSASGQQQQANYLNSLVKVLDNANMNAVFFQVRGFCDAMYNSKYEPWSQYLTGTRGKAPNYDPLQLIVDSAHAKGIEVHAWLNPYRYASSDATYGKNDPKDYYNTNPDWLVKCGEITILNPALPEVREQICKVVADIVENYDVDGIIFDDYFHQSGYQNSYDDEQYNAYKESAGANAMSRADWRRAQNNLMVRMVNDTIKAIKPWVKFGVGPAGVAGKAETSAPVYGVEPCPSPSSDWQYNQIYADPLAWYNEHTIDYMAPQIYWKISSYTNYDLLCEWWSDMACHFGRHMYVSHSLSALKADNLSIGSSEFHADEIGAQTELNRKYDRMNAPGSCWYGFSTGIKTNNFIDYIATEVNPRPAVVPQMTWYHSDDCIYVSNIRTEGNKLVWDAPADNLRYAVYRFTASEEGRLGVIAQSINLIGTTYTNSIDIAQFANEMTQFPMNYAVAVLDRFGNEYPARTMDNTQWGKSPAAQLVYPANGGATLMPCNVTWHPAPQADSYFFQMSKAADFSTLDYEYEVADTTFFLGKIYWLKDDSTYYWRVRTRSINKEDTYSEIRSFSGAFFRIQYPAEGDTCALTPTFVCDSINYANVKYTFEVATSSAFTEDEIVYTATTNLPRHTMTDSLKASRDFYLRVRAAFAGADVISPIVKFRSAPLDVPVPVILSPADGAIINVNNITVTWKPQLSSGFQVEMSSRNDFPNGRLTKKYRIEDIDVFTYTIQKVEDGTWYIRVKASAEGGYTQPSEMVTVHVNTQTAVDDAILPNTPIKIVENGQVFILRNGIRYNLLGNTAQ